MKLDNRTEYRDKDLRAVLADALGGYRRVRWLTVIVLRAHKGINTSDSSGEGKSGPVTMKLYLQSPDFFPADFAGQGYKTLHARDWQERLFFLAAHELHHIMLERAGEGDRDTEEAADRYALWRLRVYRIRRLLGRA